MKNSKLSVSIGPKLTEDVLLLEGITRAGKFLVGNLLQGLVGVEHYQYVGIVEHLPYMARMGSIEPKVAKAMMKCQLDNYIYDQMVGRNLNFRKVDKSAIHNVPDLHRYQQRLEEKDDARAMAALQKGGLYFPFIAHETMPNISLFLELYPKMKVVHVERNPIGLAYSWYQRGFGKRWGQDPKLFVVAYEDAKGPLPWFAAQWAEEYHKSGEVDRILRSMLWLFEESQKTYNSLPPEQKSRIIITSYECLLTKPQEEMDRLAKFLGRQHWPHMEKIMKDERLPAAHPKEKRAEKLAELAKTADKKLLNELIELSNIYDEKDQYIG